MTRDRYLFVVLFLGVVLAVLSIFFPLPELVLSSFLVTDLLRTVGVLATFGSVSLAVREDFVEALAGASLAIWRDLEETFHLIYVLAPLLWYWLIAVGAISVVDLSATFRSTPVRTVVFGTMLVAAGGHAVVFAVRLSQRIRERALGGELPPRIPLALLPVGLAIAVVWLVVAPAAQGGIARNALTELDLGTALLVAAVASILLSVLTVRYPTALSLPGLGWSPEDSDHAAAAVAAVVVVFGLYPGLLVAEQIPRATLALGLVTGPLSLSSLWLGPKFLLPDRSVDDGERLRTGIKRGLAIVVLYLPFSVIREAFVAGWSPPAPVAFVAGAIVVVLGGIAGIASLCTFVFVLTLVLR